MIEVDYSKPIEVLSESKGWIRADFIGKITDPNCGIYNRIVKMPESGSVFNFSLNGLLYGHGNKVFVRNVDLRDDYTAVTVVMESAAGYLFHTYHVRDKNIAGTPVPEVGDKFDGHVVIATVKFRY